MIRVLNFFCLALMGLTILGLYHISEKTRIARMELNKVDHQIRAVRSNIGVLQTEWAQVAGPARVQKLALADGMTDTASVQLSSFQQLPRRGEAPLNNSPLRDANALAPQSPAPTVHPPLSARAISDRTGF